MGLDTAGICFHLGYSEKDIDRALQISRRLFDFATKLGVHFDTLNIGGSFPGVFSGAESFEKNVASIVNGKIEEYFPLECFKKLKIIAEPGTYYAISAFTITVTVVEKKKVAKSDRETANTLPAPTFMYYLNDGACGAFSRILTGLPKDLELSLLKEDSSELFLSRIWGPVGVEHDIIEANVMLPELNNGGWLTWKNMGAYTFGFGGTFCGYRTTAFYNVMSKRDLNLLEELAGKKVFTDLKYH